MNKSNDANFGNSFERIFVALISIATGITLIYLAIEGPLILHHIRYKTADIINNQLVGQDIINMLVLSPILIVGGVTLFFRKRISQYLLILTPFYLIYYVLSYYHWVVSGAQQNIPETARLILFTFFFILISSLVILLYSLSIFPKKCSKVHSKRRDSSYTPFFFHYLILYSLRCGSRKSRRLYLPEQRVDMKFHPTAFWVIRIFDLGFTIPLGLISVYLLWVRPNTTYPIQFMFYGFFLTMIIAVNTMGGMMFT